MNHKIINRFMREESGIASILEYSIVLPFCLFTIVFLFMCGYVLNQRAVLDSASERAVIIAQKIYNDPNYLKIVVLENSQGTADEIDYVGYKSRVSNRIEKLESDPYRYWNNSYKADIIKNYITTKAQNIIIKNQLLPLSPISKSQPKIDVSPMSGIIFKNMSVTITQTIGVPVLRVFDIAPVLTMESTASVNITNPTELIRNSHFAWDITNDLTKGGAADVVNKVFDVFDKISAFFHSSETN